MPRPGFKCRRRFFALLVPPLLAGALLVSCRPKDPLDWRVKAGSLREFNRWQLDVTPDLDEPLAREFQLAVHNLAVLTPGFRNPRSEDDLRWIGNPLCKRIDRRTIREVLIAYYEADNERLLQAINVTLDTQTQLIRQSAEDDSTLLARRIVEYKTMIETERELVRQHDERLKELRGAARK